MNDIDFVSLRYQANKLHSELLEQIYVHDVYDRIATDFDAEDHQPRPCVKDFLMQLESGSLVADIGSPPKYI